MIIKAIQVNNEIWEIPNEVEPISITDPEPLLSEWELDQRLKDKRKEKTINILNGKICSECAMDETKIKHGCCAHFVIKLAREFEKNRNLWEKSIFEVPL